MPFNRYEDSVYLDRLLQEAINQWDPAKPRRWLARYGGLNVLGIGRSDCARKYRELQVQAAVLTRRKRCPESTHSLPDIAYPDW